MPARLQMNCARGGRLPPPSFLKLPNSQPTTEELSLEDAWLIAQHIEVTDADIDDSWLPAERYEELLAETPEERAATVHRIIESERMESGEVSNERVSLIRA